MESILEIVLVTVCVASVFLNFVFALYLNKIEKSLKMLQSDNEKDDDEFTIKDLVSTLVRVEKRLSSINHTVSNFSNEMNTALVALKQDMKGQLDRYIELQTRIVESQSPKNNWENMKKVFSRGRGES